MSKILQKAGAAVLVLLAVCLFAGLAFAGNGGGFTSGPSGGMGGYTGPGPALTTVRQAIAMGDDSHVTLQGKLVQFMGGDKYLFRDATGEVIVDIDGEDWGGQNVSPNDTVEISGEVDKDWNNVEIDVKRIVKK